MLEMEITLQLLFEQLGLESDDQAIEQFIATHQLDQDTPLHEAKFWSENQRDFIITHWKRDDEWVMVIDSLNAQLHQNDGED